MLVYHYAEALDLSRAAGVEMKSIEEPARRALRDAGERAMALHAYLPALRFYEQALELWPENDPEHARLLFQHAHIVFLAIDEARIDLLEGARDALLAQENIELAAEAEILIARAIYHAGAAHLAVDRADSARALLRRAASTPAKASVLANRARLLALTGNSKEAVAAGHEALAMATELSLDELRANASTRSASPACCWTISGESTT